MISKDHAILQTRENAFMPNNEESGLGKPKFGSNKASVRFRGNQRLSDSVKENFEILN